MNVIFTCEAHSQSATGSARGYLLIARIKPKHGIIQVGAGNQYGHPHPETLLTLSAHQVKILRTDHRGTIVVTTDGKDFSIRTER